MRSTGTYDNAAGPQLKCQQLGRVAMPASAQMCDKQEVNMKIGGDRKPTDNKVLCDAKRSGTKEDEKATGRTRTVDLRFTKTLVRL